MTDGVASPLRVGLIGLGRPGLYLMERFAAGGSFRVVAALADPIVADVVSPFGANGQPSPRTPRGGGHRCRLVRRTRRIRNAFTPADALCEKHAIVETLLTLSSSVPPTEPSKRPRIATVYCSCVTRVAPILISVKLQPSPRIGLTVQSVPRSSCPGVTDFLHAARLAATDRCLPTPVTIRRSRNCDLRLMHSTSW